MSFARSVFTVSSLTIVSRIAGFIRDTATAMLLGAGPMADAAFVAQRLPNLFRSLFAEGAFSATFVPLYTAEREKNGEKAAQHFAGQALALLLAVLIPFSGLIMLLMPFVVRVIAPGFENDPEKYGLTVTFSNITFPYLALISVTALQGGLLNAQGKFGAAAAAPIALNIVTIAALLGAHFLGFSIAYALSWSLTLGGAVQLGFLAISCHRAGVPIPLALPKLSAQSRLLFKRIGPGALGAGATQVNMLLSTILASTLPTGIVACLSYADRLEQLPQGIVGVAVATTLLPLLARHVETGSEDNVRHYMSRAIEFCVMLGLPSAIGFVIAAHPIVQTLFEHGAFSPNDTTRTAQALAAYALGIPAFLAVKIFASGFFARQDTATPVKIALFAMMVNVVGAVSMLHSLQHVGIALASSIAVTINAVLLFVQLRRKGRMTDAKLIWRLPRLLSCSIGMGFVTWALVGYTQDWFTGHRLWHEIGGLTAIIGVSAIAYGLMLHATGAMRWSDAVAVMKRSQKSGGDAAGDIG